MGKKVLILAGSPRKGGNSDLLCDEFARGAEEAGHKVEKIYVQEQKIGFCRACYGCRGTGSCVQRDDMAPLLDKMVEADVIVLATPVYFYSMDAQLKALRSAFHSKLIGNGGMSSTLVFMMRLSFWQTVRVAVFWEVWILTSRPSAAPIRLLFRTTREVCTPAPSI